jgi:phage protein D
MNQYYAPDFEVTIQGLTMEADVKNAVISLTYDNNLDQADMFHLTLNNADMRLTDSALFDAGKTVEIHMGYAGNLKPMMLGEIVSVSPSFPEGGAPTISITGYDKSHRMRHNHKTRSFKFSNASLIAAQIAAENLLVPVVDPSPVSLENKTQNCSDMALLNELARPSFFDTYVHWDKLYFRFPRPQTEAVILEWGKNLSSFNPRLSTSGQVGLLSIQDYDQKLAQTIVGLVPVVATDVSLDNIIERLGSNFVDLLTDLGTRCISGESLDSFPDALSFAKAILEEILEGLFEGSGSCIGIPELRAGEMVDISGVGKRFSGKYRLRTVNHTINGSGYRTSFEVTQRSSATVLQLFRKIFEENPSPNKQKKVNSPVIGKVLNNIDTERLGRVQVTYPWLCGTVISSWARVLQPDIGTYFMPDIGDDVCVSFDKGDFDRPIVTGTFWNVQKTPPETATPATNYKKVIQSREGHTIVLDDTPKQGGILLQTSDKAKASLSLTADGGIILQSAGGAKIVLSETGDISIEAKGSVVIKSGTGNIDLNP